MKKGIIILCSLLVCATVAGQSKIIFDEYLLAQTGIIYSESGFLCSKDSSGLTKKTMQWTINGLTFKPTTDTVILYPHEKGIDTIFFQQTICSETTFDTIFSRIPNGQEFVMTVGCCDNKFDIIRKKVKEEVEQLYSTEPPIDSDSLYSLYLENLEFGKIKFEILNKPISDTLICVCTEMYFFHGQQITAEKDYGWVEPCRFGIIDNIIKIHIIKINEHTEYKIIEDKDEYKCFNGIDMVEWNGDNMDDAETLKQFGLRLFNNEKVIIQYDYLTGEIKLIFDED